MLVEMPMRLEIKLKKVRLKDSRKKASQVTSKKANLVMIAVD